MKAAVIGCGGAGQQHARGYVQAPASQLVAVCDVDPQRAQCLAAQWHVAAYTSFEELLEKERPDVVSVATGEYHHVEPTIAALQAGANVLCEKIMAHSLAAGEAMQRTAQRTGKVLGVNYNYRHVPAYILIRDHLAAGTIGAPVLLAAQAQACIWHHMLDLICFFLGQPTAVEAAVLDDPTARPTLWQNQKELLYQPSTAATATFHFATGALATIAATAHVPLSVHSLSYTIYGHHAMVSLNHAQGDNLLGMLGPGPLTEELRRQPPYSWQDSMVQSVVAFVSALCEGSPPISTGADGLAMMRLEAAVVQSARIGGLINLEKDKAP